MTKTAEKNLWNSMREALRVFRENVHYTRIENSVSDSFPDVEVQLYLEPVSYHCTIELKTASRPANSSTNVPVHVRSGQSRWLRKRWNVKGSSWLFIQVGSRYDLARYLIPGNLAMDVEEGRTEEWLAEHSVCGPKDPLDQVVKLACTWRTHHAEADGL